MVAEPASLPATSPHDTRSAVLFGGVYGSVLACAMVAALTQYGHASRASRRYDALWLLVTALASALAHGYAHIIAERGPHRGWAALRSVLRTLLDEWPLVTAVLPTVVILAGAGWGWWPPNGVEYPAFVLNITLLFTLGLVTARWAGRGWGSALLIGVADAMLGLVVVVANAVIK